MQIELRSFSLYLYQTSGGGKKKSVVGASGVILEYEILNCSAGLRRWENRKACPVSETPSWWQRLKETDQTGSTCQEGYRTLFTSVVNGAASQSAGQGMSNHEVGGWVSGLQQQRTMSALTPVSQEQKSSEAAEDIKSPKQDSWKQKMLWSMVKWWNQPAPCRQPGLLLLV